MESPDGIGEELRALRLARGLSLGTAAALAGVSTGSVFAWERGARPRGPALERLLDALGADARQRARLLHAADPAHARLALVRSPLGPPVPLGHVLRAMRRRRGMTQATLAARVGVTQGAAARWESGDSTPDATTLHAALFALGASAEEAVAATLATGEGRVELSDDPKAAWFEMDALLLAAEPLREVLELGLEAEIWRRAVRDARWDETLALRIGARANRYVFEGRFAEAESTARAALRLATTPEMRLVCVPAMGTLVNVSRHRKAHAGAVLPRLEAWMERLLPRAASYHWHWAHSDRALCLAELALVEEAEAAAARAAEVLLADSDRHRLDHHLLLLGEVYLRAGVPGRALDLLPQCPSAHLEHWLLRARILHANGLPAPESDLERIRRAMRLPGNDVWLRREAFSQVERAQARLVGTAR